MLRLILGILKIIGILFLVLVLLVLILILAVLFVPVRYRLAAVHTEQDSRAELRITWLLHLISIRAAYDLKQKEPVLRIYIAGIRPKKLREFLRNRKRWKRKNG
ncbi:MAG: hypothetical protein LUH07_08180, partial [Lachnospiraceae bacterium]|nr:hypothetical protein [Lachnospiraceae bacterium]